MSDQIFQFSDKINMGFRLWGVSVKWTLKQTVLEIAILQRVQLNFKNDQSLCVKKYYYIYIFTYCLSPIVICAKKNIIYIFFKYCFSPHCAVHKTLMRSLDTHRGKYTQKGQFKNLFCVRRMLFKHYFKYNRALTNTVPKNILKTTLKHNARIF